jgi:mono/diheme cytochrome c family protein
MYRGVIQHITYLTPWLRRQYLERGLHEPLHQGRIWRIVPESAPRKTAASLHGMSPLQLVAELSSPNGWRRDTAQRLLVESGDSAAVPELQKLSKTGAEPLGRLHALWSLAGLEKLDAATAVAALADTDQKVRAAAVRLVEGFAQKDPAVAQTLLGLENDTSADVQLQLLLSLGELNSDAARETMAAVLQKNIENALARSAALSGLKGRELPFLQELLTSEDWATASTGREALLGQLVRCILEERQPERISTLLGMVISPPAGAAGWQRAALLASLTGPLPKNFKPVKFTEEPPIFGALSETDDTVLRTHAPKLAELITWPGKPGEKTEQKPPALTEPQKLFVAEGKNLYGMVCVGCHLPQGQGQEGLAPPLAGSEWVQGPEQRLIRIVLHGVGGPITVNGTEYNMDMPGIGAAFSDEQIAQVLSYIRRDFGNEAPVVDTATVNSVRAATKDRGATWTAVELLNIH